MPRNLPATRTTTVERVSPQILVMESLTPSCASDWFLKPPGTLGANALDGADELLILGGGDATPECYDQIPEADDLYGINIKAEKFELPAIDEAIRQGKPTLGIYRGMPLIHIARGGSLTQRVGEDAIHSGTVDNAVMAPHSIDLMPGSIPYKIYARRKLQVRSGRHQAINIIGQGLNILAQAEDGLIVAIEENDANGIVEV